MKENTTNQKGCNIMEDKNVNVTFGGFGTLLGIAFIVLKLCKVIDWAWIWVLAPIWISWGIALIIIIACIIIAALLNR